MPATDRDPMPLRLWLASLGTLCAGSMTPDEVRSRIAALDAALSAEFDRRAFCVASVRHVARSVRFFPTFGEICASLTEWWRDNRASVERHSVLPSQVPQGRARESQVPYEPRAPRHLGRPSPRRRWSADDANAEGSGLRSVADVLPAQQEHPAHG